MKFNITDGQIKALDRWLRANDQKWASHELHAWFPEAFEPEWEEVPLERWMVWVEEQKNVLAVDTTHGDLSAPFKLSINENSGYRDHYKIESGKIWRRKDEQKI